VQFDATGKVSLDHIYAQPDPRAYFSTLRELDYCIPQLAKPYFIKFIEEYCRSQRNLAPNILDIGCSYGINAALLRYDATMDELYERYCDSDARTQTRSTLLTRDQELARSRNRLTQARFVGLDTSHPALSYALSAGFIDDAVHADLEERDPTERQRQQFAGMDLVISTGCLGYVSHRTISRVVAANGERRPWMAHFVLRMFPFGPVADSLAGLGYETVHLERVFKQRRFASPQEQSLVLDTLRTVGVDPRGLETDGWLYAKLYISRPLGARRSPAVDFEDYPELLVQDLHQRSGPRETTRPRS
jgi:carnitine O-acetyltransferase